MKHISVYDDTSDLIEAICEELDLTEPELIDILLDETSNDEIQYAIRRVDPSR